MLGAQQSGLKLSRPTVPARTAGLRFKGLDYLGATLDYEFTEDHMVFTVVEAGAAGQLCVVDGSGHSHSLSSQRTVLPLSELVFPAVLGPCLQQ